MVRYRIAAVFVDNGVGVEQYDEQDYSLVLHNDYGYVIATPFENNGERYLLPLGHIVQITEVVDND